MKKTNATTVIASFDGSWGESVENEVNVFHSDFLLLQVEDFKNGEELDKFCWLPHHWL